MSEAVALGIAAGFVVITTATALLTVFRAQIRHVLYARKIRSELSSHPRQWCRYCGGIATRLILDQPVGVTGAQFRPPVYRCKNSRLCRETRLLKKLLDSV